MIINQITITEGVASIDVYATGGIVGTATPSEIEACEELKGLLKKWFTDRHRRALAKGVPKSGIRLDMVERDPEAGQIRPPEEGL